ncbi:MAG: porin family protein [Chelatococcus sp.]|jgi:opacity protein-like surface antigen|uniref:outer membrane protein n=1 Tax=unclassified Chelatococcus TaxID=2638111 RepID=UPI001BD066D2|nr:MULTISPECIES: outer membrane beta-barrel protein [unclassified Chelatococcus]CAH1660180.1 Opacity protein-like surface antigen [Hyphomicrobiales bacterium]MBS7741059.1 porin family protein [Chelatococcus sp. HY11]MBX3538312.1 porin family protein [Chelatococcus sp.]MBX3545245.1 porin family protein [Chelatococcus sp.]MCO5077879.1 outer membrane beta-barrel protein [Chelatococcus sp.]
MRGMKSIVLAGSFVVGSMGAGLAADLLPPPPPLAPPVPLDMSGWYLRGDIGFSNQQVDKLDNVLYQGTTVVNINKDFDAAPFAGVGVGYKFNNWFRTDLTTEYRARANFKGLDIYEAPYLSTGYATDQYSGGKTEWTTLLNAYFDLGTWSGITPFVGAGIGVTRNTITGFTDTNIITQGLAYGRDKSKWNLAWALYAGLGYEVTPNFTVELAYRYLNLGDAESGDLITYTGYNSVYNPMKFKDLSSHDIKIGLRWMLGGPSYAAMDEPLMRSY